MSRAWKAIVMFVLWRTGGLRSRRQGQPEVDPSERHTGAPAWAELLVVAVLLLVPVAALAFVALFVLDPNTQLLGLALGAALALLACALVLAGRWLVPQETKVEQRPRLADPDAAREVIEQAAEGVEGITRRRLLAGAAGVAGAGLTAAVVIPVAALGPGLEEQLRRTPWRAGRALVDEQGNPMLAADIIERSFQTAFPQGAAEGGVRRTWAPPSWWCALTPRRCGYPPSVPAGHRRASLPTRRSAPMPRALSRCFETRSAHPPSPRGRRWCAPATTPRSTYWTVAASSSAPQAGRCRSCR